MNPYFIRTNGITAPYVFSWTDARGYVQAHTYHFEPIEDEL